MPLDITTRREKTAEITFKFEGEPIKLTYGRGLASAEWYASLGQEPVAIKLSEVLISWDVTDGGKPYVPERGLTGAARVEAWQKLFKPLEQALLRDALDAILDDLRPTEATQKK